MRLKRKPSRLDFATGTHAATKADEVFAKAKEAAEEKIGYYSGRGTFYSGTATTKTTASAVEAIQSHARVVLDDLRSVAFAGDELKEWVSVWGDALERVHADTESLLRSRLAEGEGSLREHIVGEVDRSLRQCKTDLAAFSAAAESAQRTQTTSRKHDVRMMLYGAVIGSVLLKAVETLISALT